MSEQVMAGGDSLWSPSFECQEWRYQSFLTLPSPEEDAAAAGASVTAKKWAKGSLTWRVTGTTSGRYSLVGKLSFGPGIELQVSAECELRALDQPATFEGTGTALAGPIKGAAYRLTGWVFAEQPVVSGVGKVSSVRGSVQAVRGPDIRPSVELGGMVAGTVGSFAIDRADS